MNSIEIAEMYSNDLLLVHCVELTCRSCGHTTRIARHHHNAGYGNVNLLVKNYRHDILSHDLYCPKCKKTYEEQSVTIARDEVIGLYDSFLVHCVEVTCSECKTIVRFARCLTIVDAKCLYELLCLDI